MYLCISVPGRPENVRGVVSGLGKFIVYWGNPKKKGGKITSYIVNWRVVGSRTDSGRGRQGVITVDGNSDWVEVSIAISFRLKLYLSIRSHLNRNLLPATRAEPIRNENENQFSFLIGGDCLLRL